ncbi:amidohydrolase [Paenibacillus farraposensis]|uniref:Amidohydrolase n=1 Tax=Paenibacillus farraposensis TaxID=2807095 RepID=A0ABW4D6A2_9BACL|nr:amidohydrolase [Paenibacillus farraposensis]MCC3381671.1 amidohydrolase [Paenibacillus farraposensis]
MTFVLFKHGRLYGEQASKGDSMIVQHGRIQAIGSARELELQLSGKEYQTVDWEDAYVLPGLADSHMHLSMYGMKLAMLDLTSAASKEEMLAMLRKRVAVTPPGEWILGLNWNENAFIPVEIPGIAELDAITDQHPVYLTRTCFHTFLANSEAFRRAGISDSTPDPASGAYGRDAEGRLNGLIYEEASFAFTSVQPKPDYTVKKETIRRACLDALRLGLTGAHTEDLRFLGSVETMQRIYRELREEGLAFRTHQLIYHPYMEEAKVQGLRAGSGNEWYKIGAIKMFADGAIGGRTALLSEPYSDAPHTRGMAIQPQAELNQMVAAARATGFPVAVHAIGDGAAQMILTAMETHALTKESGLPDRLIHGQVLTVELVRRMAKLPLIADIQPRFVASDFPWVLERVGEERTEYLYAWKRLLGAGIPCAGGSDAPIEPLNPFLGMHAAVTRAKPEDMHEGYLPAEKLNVHEAIQLFTTGSAVAAGEAGERGLLAEGKAADFTVIDRDISENPQALLDVKVRMTVVNGQVAYQS